VKNKSNKTGRKPKAAASASRRVRAKRAKRLGVGGQEILEETFDRLDRVSDKQTDEQTIGAVMRGRMRSEQNAF
jgi:hypothetical protein